jgi:hypothetical protein
MGLARAIIDFIKWTFEIFIQSDQALSCWLTRKVLQTFISISLILIIDSSKNRSQTSLFKKISRFKVNKEENLCGTK